MPNPKIKIKKPRISLKRALAILQTLSDNRKLLGTDYLTPRGKKLFPYTKKINFTLIP